MAKLTLDSLRKLREEQKKEFLSRNKDGKDIEIIVGMGTCGNAAGAKKTYDAFVKTLESAGVSNARIKQTGCMGLCYAEPTVEIHAPDMPDILYGKVDEETAIKIVHKHIQGKVLLNNHIYNKPSADIVFGEEE